jgi:hypothetical protein
LKKGSSRSLWHGGRYRRKHKDTGKYPEFMARRRPELSGWDNSVLKELESADSTEWVLMVLTTGKDVLGKVRAWSFGEIREAVRREIERRGTVPEKARNLAGVRTMRGLASLEREGVVAKRGGRYRVSRGVRLLEWNLQQVRDAVKRGTRVRIEIGPRGNPYVAEYG